MRTVIASVALVLLAATPAMAEDVAPSPAPTAADGVQIPDFKTKAWILVDASSGDILAGQDFEAQRPMASTIKMLTALTLLPRLQYDSTYEAKPQETLTEGAHVGVLSGNKYTVSQLFHGMMMRSGNDAAVALADAYGFKRTIDTMNTEAQRIGATNTVAKTPNGLDRPGQVSTAKDLAQIYRVAIQDPRIQETLTFKEAEFPGRAPEDPTRARNTFTIYNHDALLDSGYPGFLGGKSGFTSQAGRTYVAGVDRDGRTFVVALLGIGGGTTETAREVLDWGYANADALQPIGQLPALPEPADVTPVPAGSLTGDDLAPMPLDAQTQAEVTTVAQNAQYVAEQASNVDVPSVDEIAQAAQDAAVAAVTASGGTSIDPAQISSEAQTVAASALTAASSSTAGTQTTGTALGADAIVAGLSQSPFVATEPAVEQAGDERGFFATVLIGLFKAVAWLLLFLGVAVVLLRIRAIRRQKARREAMARQRRTLEREPANLR
jgi:D-alanyl-D-alanine carboxypeptidase (penicillin-binding protein 5/6)